MVIKIYVGPKEKEFYQQKAQLMGWDADDVITALLEDVNECFFDMIQQPPHGVTFTEVDENFDEEDAQERLEYMKA